MKKLLSILMIISIFASIFTFSSITSSATESETGIEIFADCMCIYDDVNSQNLKTLLQGFTAEQLTNITLLHLNDANISDSGLDNEDLTYVISLLPNLRSLNCMNQPNVSDISFIEGNTSLKGISFNNCNISDISPVATCPNLESVTFPENNVTDISPIYSLENLRVANFSYNQIRDVTGLKEYYESHFTTITYIFLNYNPLGGQLSYIESIEYYSRKIKLEGIYSDEPLGEALVTPEDFRACVFDYVTVDNESKVITINSKPGAKSYVAFYINSSIKQETGGTIRFSMTEVAGEVEKYVPTRYKIYKPADSNTYTTTITAETPNLSPVTYTLVVNFVKAPFDVAKLSTRYAENVAYDTEAKTLTMDSTSPNITRIYKSIGNGEKLSIDLEKYDFITEYPNFYQINRAKLKATDLNIASFDIITTTDETIKATVNFPGAGKLPMNMFKITRYSELTQDGTTITLDIVDGYTYSCIYKDVKDGSTLTITSDSKYVEERDNCYVLRAKAAGEQITLTYGGVDYTVNLVK